MKFAAKLKKLTEGMRRAELARKATVKPSVLNNYINRGSEPMALAAFRLAKALDVSLVWLLDDSADWPPPATATITPGQFSDAELMLEVGRRHRLSVLRLLALIDEAEKIDWKKASATEPAIKLLPVVLGLKYSIEILTMYSAEGAAIANHNMMPGADRPPQEFYGGKILRRAAAILENEDFRTVGSNLLAIMPNKEIEKIEHDVQWAGARFEISPSKAASTDSQQSAQLPAPPANVKHASTRPAKSPAKKPESTKSRSHRRPE